MGIKQVSETPIFVTVVIALVAAAWWYDAIDKQNGYQFSKQWPMRHEGRHLCSLHIVRTSWVVVRPK